MHHLSREEQRVLRKALKRSVKVIHSAGTLEYLSWFGYRPDGTCPTCGEEWDDVMFGYDGPHCAAQPSRTT